MEKNLQGIESISENLLNILEYGCELRLRYQEGSGSYVAEVWHKGKLVDKNYNPSLEGAVSEIIIQGRL